MYVGREAANTERANRQKKPLRPCACYQVYGVIMLLLPPSDIRSSRSVNALRIITCSMPWSRGHRNNIYIVYITPVHVLVRALMLIITRSIYTTLSSGFQRPPRTSIRIELCWVVRVRPPGGTRCCGFCHSI